MSPAKPPRNVTDVRPNPRTKWVCGYAHLGWTCAAGPDAKGACCRVHPGPVASLPDTAQVEQQGPPGAAVDQAAQFAARPQLPPGPAPCVPRRAAWYWRQTLMLNMAILTAGLLLLCMSLPQREAFFAPGTLSQKHSQLLGNHLISERCSLCHPNSHSNMASDIFQDDLCLKCHTRHLPQAHLRSPHDLPRTELVKLTAKWQPARISPGEHAEANAAGRVEGPVAEPTRCAVCHVEHHGSSFDLTAISDASCQACHQRQFASLSAGHPQFEDYPYRKPRRLAFDHSSHQQKHFATKNAEFQCARCHLETQPSRQLGSVSRGVSFEQACASCHQAPLEAALSGGWAVLQLPSIDASGGQTAVTELQDWPSSARFGYQGQITVPMRLLLLADPRMHFALAQLPASGRLEDIPAQGPLRGQVTRSLAQGLRSLIREVAAEGHVAWQRRLSVTATHLLARELSEQEKKLIYLLSQGVPPDLFRQMEQQWFDNHADIAVRETTPLRLASQAVDAEDLLLERPADALGDLPEDSLLLEMGSEATADALLLEPLEDASQSAEATALEPPLEADPSARLRGSLHVAAGGWYLDHQLLTLQYMPAGHADRTLAVWAEFAALLDAAQHAEADNYSTDPSDSSPRGGADSAEHKLHKRQQSEFGHLTHGSVVLGGCTQCHLLSAEHAGRALGTNWAAPEPLAMRQFTEFDHTPHLTLTSLSDCSHCHVLQGNHENSLGEFLQAANEPRTTIAPTSVSQTVQQFLAHEFVDMRLEQCVACHVSGGAKDACTQCHNYHVGSPSEP